MPAAPSSPDEAGRLAAVKKLRLMGTPAEDRFDAITRMARDHFGMPLACLDIAGDQTLWLKSVQGFDGVVGHRKDSYCHYTILDDGVCVIRDARTDPRVQDSALTESWVFYAGVPLHFEGQRVGVLCIGDGKPRDFNASHFNALMTIAGLAEKELEASVLSPTQVALPDAGGELEMEKRIDLLTHLWNEEAILEVARRDAADGHPLAVMMIEVDHLEEIRASSGSALADQVLRSVAERLRGVLPPSDALGRYSDGIFMAVLADAGAREAELIGQRLRQAIAAAPVQHGQSSVPITCSVGYVASADFAGQDAEALTAQALKALARAFRAQLESL